MGLPFLSSRAKKRDHIVAIDLGGRATKAVHLQRKGEKFTLANYAVMDTPVSDKAISAETLTEHLKSVSKALGNTHTRSVTLAVGVNDVVFRQIEAPQMPAADLRQMLKLNSKNYLSEDFPNHVFDCSFAPCKQIPKSNDGAKSSSGVPKNRVIVGGIKRQLLDDLKLAAKGAGFITDQVVPGIVGPPNAFEFAEPEAFAKEAVALVDIGYRNTTVILLDGGDVMLHRVVSIGGDHLTAGLAEAMNVSYPEAESIKVGMPAEVRANLEALIHPLGQELRASIVFYEHQSDKTIGQVFISGASARCDLILEALQNELMVPCKMWNPAKSFEISLPSDKLGEVEQAIPQLTVAIGAAATGF